MVESFRRKQTIFTFCLWISIKQLKGLGSDKGKSMLNGLSEEVTSKQILSDGH